MLPREHLKLDTESKRMTVYELIIWLKKMPMTATVHYADGEYKDSTSSVSSVKLQKEATLGHKGNSVIIS
jgi:hypothetical protein